MQQDALLLARLLDVARPLLIGATIRECQATPDGRGLLVALAGAQGIRGMLFSLNARHSRWHLIDDMPSRIAPNENHLSMVARQKLAGAVILDITQTPGDRVLDIRCERREFTGASNELRLIAELMGPDSNLLVVEGDGTILATWRIAHAYDNAYREIRPGKAYVPPPPAGRFPMRPLPLEEWTKFAEQQAPERPWQGSLLATFRGLTPGVVQAACEVAGIGPRDPVGNITPIQLRAWAGAIEDLWVEVESGTRLPPWEQWLTLDPANDAKSLHLAAGELFAEWELADRGRERSDQWRAAIKAREKDLTDLRGHLYADLRTHREAVNLKLTGDLIFGSIHLFPADRSGYEITVEVPDLFATAPELDPNLDLSTVSEAELERLTDPGQPLIAITIPADKSAQQVAREAYHRAGRAQRGIVEVTKRLAAAAHEIELLKLVKDDWSKYTTADPDRWKQVIASLRLGKPLPAPPVAKGMKVVKEKVTLIPQALAGISLQVYKLPEDLIAFIGGNAHANETLWRYGEPEHLWLHAKGVPGSHVLICTPAHQIPPEAMVEAARLAVSHSSVKEGTKITVDYTKVRYLKKPPGTAPGYVTYTRERTILADPFSLLELKRRRLNPTS